MAFDKDKKHWTKLEVLVVLTNLKIVPQPATNFNWRLTPTDAAKLVTAYPNIADYVMCKEIGDDDDWQMCGGTYELEQNDGEWFDCHQTFEIWVLEN